MTAPAMARLYGARAVAGAAFPLAAFVPWAVTHGFDPGRFAGDLFANRISGFFALDVIVSALVLILFVTVQGRRDFVPRPWLPIAATLLIGVSCGLPLFLALREHALARQPHRGR